MSNFCLFDSGLRQDRFGVESVPEQHIPLEVSSLLSNLLVFSFADSSDDALLIIKHWVLVPAKETLKAAFSNIVKLISELRSLLLPSSLNPWTTSSLTLWC